jgi:hypothetical protein
MSHVATDARRELHFDRLEEGLGEAESLASSEVHTIGNYSFGQIIEHLARTLDVVTGTRESPKIALPLRLAARLVRGRLLSKPMKPGFKLPSGAQSVFWPEADVPTDAALAHLREAAERFRRTEPLPPHPVFGPMTRAQHEQLQCRHFELHLSFVQRK